MQRIAVDDTTDLATVYELAGNPEIELEITNLYPRYPRLPYYATDFIKLPDHVRAKLITRHRMLYCPNVMSCGDISMYGSGIFCASKLERCGNIWMPYVKRFVVPRLRTAGVLGVDNAEIFVAPSLEKAESIYAKGLRPDTAPKMHFGEICNASQYSTRPMMQR